MEGDLNLSQALGGLRIANQTDDSPPPSPRDAETHSPTIHIPDLQQLSQGIESHSPGIPAGGLSQTPPLGPPTQLRQSANYPPNTPPSRPTSQYLGSYPSGPPVPYHSQSSPSSVAIASTNPLMYPDFARVSREPSRSSLSGPAMGASRHLQRERSNTDRSYRQSAPSGPYPPRGSSRGMAQSGLVCEDRGAYVCAGGPYTLENGPLSSSEEWQERGAAVGIQRETDANGNAIMWVVKKGVKDFNFGRTLGEGSYSTVSLFAWGAGSFFSLPDYIITRHSC